MHTPRAISPRAFLLLGGPLADLLGRRRVFIFGLVLFALASLAGGFATSEGALIAARAVQGLGAAIPSPAALSIVTTTFRDGAERNTALGVSDPRGGDPSAMPVTLTEGFQAAFLGGAAIAVLGLVLTLTLIRERDSRTHVELGGADPGAERVEQSGAQRGLAFV